VPPETPAAPPTPSATSLLLTDGADRLRRIGAIDPLVITTEDVISSGHRRNCANDMLGLTTAYAVRFPIHSTDRVSSTS